jgi:hypothetical protein
MRALRTNDRWSVTKKYCVALAVAGLATVASRAFATPISLSDDGTQPDVSSVSDAAGPSAALSVGAFEFFGVNTSGNDVSSNQLSQFGAVAKVAPSDFGPGSGYSSLTISGTLDTTGVIYSSGRTTGTLATITLGASVPSNLVLGLLGNNTNDAGNNTTYTVTAGNDGVALPASESAATVNDGYTYTGTTSPVVDGPPYNGTGYAYNNEADFFFVSVSNATPGETLTITGYAPNEQITLGGLTFTASTPEPTSLCGMALFGIGALIRRRRLA